MEKSYFYQWIESLEGLSINLHFNKIISETNEKITALYNGRSLNGSYIYEQEMVSTYLNIFNSNPFGIHFSYKGEDNVYTYGKYVFEISKTKKTLSITKPKGKIYSASQYEAFRIDIGYDFAIMQIISERLFLNKENYKEIGIVLDGNNVYIDNLLYWKIDKLEKPEHKHFKGHKTDMCRTYFDSSFECFVESKDLLNMYLNKYKESLNFNYKIQGFDYHCEKSYIQRSNVTSDSIVLKHTDSDYDFSVRLGDGFPILKREKVKQNSDERIPLYDINEEVEIYDKNKKISANISGWKVNKTEGVTYSYSFIDIKDNKKWYCSGGLKQLDILNKPKQINKKLEKLFSIINFDTFPFKFYQIEEYRRNDYMDFNNIFSEVLVLQGGDE